MQTNLPYTPPLGRRGEKIWVSIWASVPSSAKICRVSRRHPFLEKMQKAFCVRLDDEARKQLAVVLWWGRRPCDYVAITRYVVYFWVGRWTSDSALWTSRHRNWRCCGQASIHSQCCAETHETTAVSSDHFCEVDHSMERILELQQELEALMWSLTRRYLKDMQKNGNISKITSLFIKYSVFSSIFYVVWSPGKFSANNMDITFLKAKTNVFVCKCVLCYCHRVSIQLQLTIMSISNM
jgi:hypothetical protein